MITVYLKCPHNAYNTLIQCSNSVKNVERNIPSKHSPRCGRSGAGSGSLFEGYNTKKYWVSFQCRHIGTTATTKSPDMKHTPHKRTTQTNQQLSNNCAHPSTSSSSSSSLHAHTYTQTHTHTHIPMGEVSWGEGSYIALVANGCWCWLCDAADVLRYRLDMDAASGGRSPSVWSPAYLGACECMCLFGLITGVWDVCWWVVWRVWQ